jgi:DNA-binding NarL/FixJ family response regulator
LIRVLLADDQALVRHGFAMILRAEAGVEVAGEAADGVEAVTLAAQLAPDVVLTDVRMPALDGIEATRRIVSDVDSPRVSNAEIAAQLVLSEHTVKSHVTHLLQKLGLRDRTQIVVLAYETGIVRRGEGL